MRKLGWCLMVLLMISCTKQEGIEGLWIVEKVKAGEEEMTPNARWVRFNEDGTQDSGNGKFQHSYGTWNVDASTNLLTIVNENGLKDMYDPFEMTVAGNEMTWRREEEGQMVEIFLEKSQKLPETHGDKILGLWALEQSTGDGYYPSGAGSQATNYVFFRWDKRFMMSTPTGRINGVYNVHGHKSEVELIPYGEVVNRDFWAFDCNENELTLQLLNTDSLVQMKFNRTDTFPE